MKMNKICRKRKYILRCVNKRKERKERRKYSRKLHKPKLERNTVNKKEKYKQKESGGGTL